MLIASRCPRGLTTTDRAKASSKRFRRWKTFGKDDARLVKICRKVQQTSPLSLGDRGMTPQSSTLKATHNSMPGVSMQAIDTFPGGRTIGKCQRTQPFGGRWFQYSQALGSAGDDPRIQPELYRRLRCQCGVADRPIRPSLDFRRHA